MSYIRLIIGLLFLTNPYLGAVDYLPDFIGLLLIARSIKNTCDISPSAQAASDALKKAAVVSLMQTSLIIPLLSIINSEPSFNLLYSFSFAVLRLIFLVPAINETFNATVYFSDRSVSGIRGIGFARIATLSFFIFHCIMSALPEVVYIAVDEYGLYSEVIFPNSIYRTGLMFLCAVIVLAVGIIWYVGALICVLKVRKNKAFNSCITEAIASVTHSVKKTVLRSVSPLTLCLTLSVFALALYFIDGRPIIPPYFSAVLQLVVICYLRSICQKKVTRAFSIIAIVFGALSQIGCEMFAAAYHDRALFAFEDVKLQFMIPYGTTAIFVFFSVLSTVITCVGVCRLIHEHTGLFWENAFITHNSRVGKEKLRQLFSVKLITVLSCLASVFSLVSYLLLYKIPEINLIATALTVALGIFGFFLFGAIKSSVIEKYTTENKMN